MAYDFPNTPTLGQIFQGYTWDGEKWGVTFNAPNQGGVIAIKVFTASGTYTPSPNCTSCLVEIWGGGGGVQTTAAAAAGQMSISAPGGSGGYARKLISNPTTQAFTVGTGGVAVAGGTTTFGAMSATGGLAGAASASTTAPNTVGGSYGTASGGDINIAGAAGGWSLASTSPIYVVIGTAGNAPSGGSGGAPGQRTAGGAGAFPGGGGGGTYSYNGDAAFAGGIGGNGGVIITEYGLTSLGSSTAASGAVRYDLPQGLTANQQVQARQNVYAAPFDAMAYNGFQINGGMQISQERGFGSPGIGNICDGWLFATAGSMVASAATYSTASFTPPPGFMATLIVGVSTAEPTLAAGDFAGLSHAVEGYRVGRLWWGGGYAQPITIGFWTMHHRTGLYTGTIRNGTNTRSYTFSYNQNVADAWEYKTVTIPGDMAGSWAIDNTAGLYVFFAMACGSTYTAPSLNTWVTGNFLAGPGQVNGVASTSDAFRITGVTILPGIEAPSAARSPLIQRPYDQELLTCQRYYAKINAAPGAYTSFATGFATTTIASGYIKYPVRMRGAPSIAYGGALAAWNGGTFYPITSMASVYAGLDSATVQFNGAFTVSAVNILANNDTTAFMWLDARF